MIILDQQKVTIILLSLVCCSLSIALAPATVGEIAASTGKLSNRLKVSTRRIFQLRGSSHECHDFAVTFSDSQWCDLFILNIICSFIIREILIININYG